MERIDVNDRVGKVYSYSIQGGLSGSDAKQGEEVHYRFRHLNTGRLIIDQEIEQAMGKMRTLGLSPHLCAKNLSSLSDKFCEQLAAELKELSNNANYDLDKGHEAAYAPKDYAEIDKRSRFRIISTSPSLDPRIKTNSCVQIQHVATEMYLSYATKGTFDVAPDARLLGLAD